GVMLVAGGACGNNPGTSASAGSSGATSSGAGGAACAEGGLWVSPDGQGDACSACAPCALETGRDHARSLAAGASSDILVMLHGGTYRLQHTFMLSAADAGQNGHAIIYRAAPGEVPVLSGAVPVSGFAPWPEAPGTWVASVPKGTHARQLWVNGRRATRAR